ncbi:MAG: hypothetical protein ACO3LE_10765, partial [Bdellovibrionota bacterium]
MRSPLVSLNRRNTNEVTTFLNYIPSYFASQMVPYFDVEFQAPFTDASSRRRPVVIRPSLFRFLEGTKDLSKLSLTDADQALLQIVSTPKSNDQKSTSIFSGMELFTSPQTMIAMDSLKADALAQVRLNDAQPFLPPASITGASISIMNAGAGSFSHKKGKLTLKVHDKARLAEFAEFFRGPVGYRDIKVWLTYGWLAPRGRGEDDVYAKFINYNMLTKECFNIYNSSFSFEATGEVNVDLELVSAGMSSLDTLTIGEAPGVRGISQKINEAKAAIQAANKILGTSESPFKEIRIFQVLEAAGAGDLGTDPNGEQLKALLNQTDKSFYETVTVNGKKQKIFRIKGLTDPQAKTVEIGLNALRQLAATTDVRFAKYSLKDQLTNTAREWVAQTFQKARSGKDPFLPTNRVKAKEKLYDP